MWLRNKLKHLAYMLEVVGPIPGEEKSKCKSSKKNDYKSAKANNQNYNSSKTNKQVLEKEWLHVRENKLQVLENKQTSPG